MYGQGQQTAVGHAIDVGLGDGNTGCGVVTLLMPIIALLLSTIFENFIWTANVAIGVVVVLVGNLFILTPAATLTRVYRRVRDV